MEQRDRVMVWLVEDLPQIRLKRKDSNDQPITEHGLNSSTEEIGVFEAEFDIGESEIIVEFSHDRHRLDRIAVPVRKKV